MAFLRPTVVRLKRLPGGLLGKHGYYRVAHEGRRYNGSALTGPGRAKIQLAVLRQFQSRGRTMKR